MHFTLEPGPVTLCHLTTDREGNFSCVVYETEIMDMPPFRNFDIPHWVVKLDEPAGDFLTRYSLAGGGHHLATAPGKYASAVRKLAILQGWKCCSV
jgi:L-arabinose isomerase